MSELFVVKREPFLFVPKNWEDTFIDSVVETYISLVETKVSYPSKGMSPLPLALELIDEDEIIMLCDKITSDIEFGLLYPEETCFKSEEEYDSFHELCLVNLSVSVYDIRVVFEHFHLSHRVGTELRNLPIKGVW